MNQIDQPSLIKTYSQYSQNYEGYDDYYPDAMMEQEVQKCHSLTVAEVYTKLEEFINELMDQSGLSFDEAMWMGLQYKWNKRTFEEQYYQLSDNQKQKDTQKRQINMCYVCLEKKLLTYLDCGHGFCSPCYAESISANIINANQFCLMDACQQKIPFALIQYVLKDKELSVYKNILIKDFIQSSNNLTYCPGVDCPFVILYFQKDEILCVCGTKTCAQCHEDHQPAPCHLVQTWQKFIKSDEPNLEWIKLNTTTCPFCKTPVQKIEGCDHIYCRPPGGCGRDFCYICGSEFKGHEEIMGKCKRKTYNLKNLQYYIDQFDSSMSAIQYAKSLQKDVQMAIEDLQRFPINYNLNDYYESYLRSTIYIRWSNVLGFFINQTRADKELDFFNSQKQLLYAPSKEILEIFQYLILNRNQLCEEQVLVYVSDLRKAVISLDPVMNLILHQVTSGAWDI